MFGLATRATQVCVISISTRGDCLGAANCALSEPQSRRGSVLTPRVLGSLLDWTK